MSWPENRSEYTTLANASGVPAGLAVAARGVEGRASTMRVATTELLLYLLDLPYRHHTRVTCWGAEKQA